MQLFMWLWGWLTTSWIVSKCLVPLMMLLMMHPSIFSPGGWVDVLHSLVYSWITLLQVRALACLYGLEARACGRAGQTLFRTGK